MFFLEYLLDIGKVHFVWERFFIDAVSRYNKNIQKSALRGFLNWFYD